VASISSLYTALSGINAQRRVMDVTSHNIANETTAGHHRQRAELAPISGAPVSAVFAGQGARPGGVQVTGVTSARDALLEARAVREQAAQSSTDLMATTLERIEGLFGEPSDGGLASQLSEFWGGWVDLADQPGGLATRTQVLERASALTDALQQTAAALNAVRASAVDRVASLATDVNGLTSEIAALNATIVANPGASNDLLDRRDLLVTSLSERTGAVARPSGNGQVDVYIGGRSVVSGTVAQLLDGTGGTLRWALDGQVVSAPSGQAAALAATITDIVPRYLAGLDDVASTVVTQVNALHSAGYDQAGTTGRMFFDPAGVTAATIALSTDVAGQPANVAAGAPVFPGPRAPGALDGEQARAIAALADSAAGADAKYGALVSRLAVETRAAVRRADVQHQITDSAVSDALQVTSVSLDEEMANLISAQRAYEASARVLTAVDELMDTLINRTGVVGR